jgi:hypothetical protein
MSGLFNFIKGLFSGIFGFLGSLFGGKKKSDTEASESTPKPAKRKNSAYFLELEDAKGTGTVESKTSTKTVPSSEPTTAKSVAVKAPEPAKLSQSVTSNNGTTQAPSEVAFASKYLLSNGSSTSRRRPGANMDYFVNMARQTSR